MGDCRAERLAKNETFFRHSNELIARDASRLATLSDIICECSSRGCMERLELTNREYEHVRSRGDWFVVAEGHEDPSIEDVVERHGGYIVVEKEGRAKVIAEADDPR